MSFFLKDKYFIIKRLLFQNCHYFCILKNQNFEINTFCICMSLLMISCYQDVIYDQKQDVPTPWKYDNKKILLMKSQTRPSHMIWSSLWNIVQAFLLKICISILRPYFPMDMRQYHLFPFSWQTTKGIGPEIVMDQNVSRILKCHLMHTLKYREHIHFLLNSFPEMKIWKASIP